MKSKLSFWCLVFWSGIYWQGPCYETLLCVNGDYIVPNVGRPPVVYIDNSNVINIGILLDILPENVSRMESFINLGKALLPQIGRYYFLFHSNSSSQAAGPGDLPFGFVNIGLQSTSTTSFFAALMFLPQTSCCASPSCNSTMDFQVDGKRAVGCLRNVVAVISALPDYQTHYVQRLLEMIDIPTFSISTEHASKDTQDHPHYIHFFPDRDTHTIDITFALLKAMSWTYISIVCEQSYDYLLVMRDFQRKLANSPTPCIATIAKVLPGSNEYDRAAVQSLFASRQRGAQVVLLLASAKTIARVWKAVSAYIDETKYYNLTFFWIATTESTESLRSLTERESYLYILNTATFSGPLLKNGSTDPLLRFQSMEGGFRSWFETLTVNNITSSDPWFIALWKRVSCPHANYSCNTSLPIGANGSLQNRIPRSDDSGSKALAIIEMLYIVLSWLYSEGQCGSDSENKLPRCVHMPAVMNAVKSESARVQGAWLHNLYSVQQEFGLDAQYAVDSGTLTLNVLPRVHNHRNVTANSGTVRSMCGSDCPHHWSRKSRLSEKCCFDCVPCSDYEIVVQLRVCQPCPKFLWPNAQTNYTTCYRILVSHVRLFDHESLPLVVLNVFVISLILGVGFFFLSHRNARVIKATSMELSLLMLLGMLLAEVDAIVTVVSTSDTLCALSAILRSMSFTFLHGALLIRSILIYRIFADRRKMTRECLVSRTSRVALTISLVVSEVSLDLVSLPYAKVSQPDTSVRYVELHCDELQGYLSSMLSVAQNVFEFCIVFMCLVLAFATRKVPDNFSESGFIFVCLCASSTARALFLMVTNVVTRELEKIKLFAFFESIRNLSFLVFLFFSKIYAFYFSSLKRGPSGHRFTAVVNISSSVALSTSSRIKIDMTESTQIECGNIVSDVGSHTSELSVHLMVSSTKEQPQKSDSVEMRDEYASLFPQFANIRKFEGPKPIQICLSNSSAVNGALTETSPSSADSNVIGTELEETEEEKRLWKVNSLTSAFCMSVVTGLAGSKTIATNTNQPTTVTPVKKETGSPTMKKSKVKNQNLPKEKSNLSKIVTFLSKTKDVQNNVKEKWKNTTPTIDTAETEMDEEDTAIDNVRTCVGKDGDDVKKAVVKEDDTDQTERIIDSRGRVEINVSVSTSSIPLPPEPAVTPNHKTGNRESFHENRKSTSSGKLVGLAESLVNLKDSLDQTDGDL